MSKKANKDKVEKKIKKKLEKSEDIYKEKLKSARMGTPPMEERELTEEQIKFAMLLAKNIPPHIAQQQCSFSDFQRRTYSQLPKMKKEIQRWREVFALEGIEKLATLFNMLQEDAILLLRERIKADMKMDGKVKITNQEIFKNIINKSFMPEDEDDNPSIKKTMRIMQTIKPKQITNGSDMNVFDGLDNDDDENEDKEIEESREIIIEEEASSKAKKNKEDEE